MRLASRDKASVNVGHEYTPGSGGNLHTGRIPEGLCCMGKKRRIEEGPPAALAAPSQNSPRIGSLCA